MSDPHGPKSLSDRNVRPTRTKKLVGQECPTHTDQKACRTGMSDPHEGCSEQVKRIAHTAGQRSGTGCKSMSRAGIAATGFGRGFAVLRGTRSCPRAGSRLVWNWRSENEQIVAVSSGVRVVRGERGCPKYRGPHGEWRTPDAQHGI